tara:strand:+ start:37 stop:789 length:753 start_codon:yes stop_codon:yes gene_type:complete
MKFDPTPYLGLGIGGSHFVVVFLFFCFLDQGFVRHVVPAKARYFVLHVVFNSWLSLTVWSNAWTALGAPGAATQGDTEVAGFSSSGMATTAGIASFHLYHACFFTGIDRETVVHHIVSCVVTPAIGIMLPFGRVLDVSNLGMCGIPGGVDYLLLALMKSQVSCAPSRLSQKRVSALMHLLVRWPLMLLSAYMFLVGWNSGMLEASSANAVVPWLMLLAVFLHSANAVYYCHKVIGNYYVAHAAAEVDKNK